jgi:two-component system sensor histidine kinase HydH
LGPLHAIPKSEDYALLLIENLNHQVFLQFILPVGLKYGKIELRNQEQFERMDSVVRSTLHSFKVEMVNIYSKKDIIAYSFSPDLVGMENVGGAFYNGALEGNSSSKLVQNGSFWEILLGIPKEIKIVTFAPIRAEKPLSPISGPVLGVVEIRQDLSSDYRKIFKFQVLVISTISIVMGILLLTLIYVVKRGEGIIEKRALERITAQGSAGQSQTPFIPGRDGGRCVTRDQEPAWDYQQFSRIIEKENGSPGQPECHCRHYRIRGTSPERYHY